MDGRLAVLFWLMSLPTGSLHVPGITIDRGHAVHRLTATVGALSFHNHIVGSEARLTYMFDPLIGGRFHPVADLSVSNKGSVFAGLGLYHQIDINLSGHKFFTGFSLIPGLYFKGGGIDLGYPLEFRSGVEFGYHFKSGAQLSVSYDHRSNARLGKLNPGVQTIALRFSEALF